MNCTDISRTFSPHWFGRCWSYPLAYHGHLLTGKANYIEPHALLLIKISRGAQQYWAFPLGCVPWFVSYKTMHWPAKGRKLGLNFLSQQPLFVQRQQEYQIHSPWACSIKLFTPLTNSLCTKCWSLSSGNTKGYRWPPVWLVWISLFCK
jgi:hypothetical protein